ncbi:MAG: hypothetical protein AAF628_25485 [Planctomycetota bacterium]
MKRELVLAAVFLSAISAPAPTGAQLVADVNVSQSSPGSDPRFLTPALGSVFFTA